MDLPDDPWTTEVRCVEAHDRCRRLAEGDPEPAPIGAEVEVVRLRADKDAVDDPPPHQVDDDQPAAARVGDVGVPVAGRDGGDFRLLEPAEDLDDAKRVPAQQGDPAVRIDDDGRTVERRGDHERVVQVDTLQDVTSVRAERDGEDIVRGLRTDERDRPSYGRSAGRCGAEDQGAEENEESAHASDTHAEGRAVPG